VGALGTGQATSGTSVVYLPVSQMVVTVERLLQRNAEIIATTSRNQNARDEARMADENVRLLQELDANLHQILMLYRELGSRVG